MLVPHETKPSESLLKILKSQKTEHCIYGQVQTKPELMRYWNITKSTIHLKIIFSNKTNVSQDVESMCQLFGCTSGIYYFTRIIRSY